MQRPGPYNLRVGDLVTARVPRVGRVQGTITGLEPDPSISPGALPKRVFLLLRDGREFSFGAHLIEFPSGENSEGSSTVA